MKKLSFLLSIITLSYFASAQKLLQAIEEKNYTGVEQYIKGGEGVNAPNENGQFPLWTAIWKHDTRMVELLLKNGADARQMFKGENEIGLLEITAQEGLLEITQLLVKNGAGVDRRSVRGQTPLRIAARNGHTELVKFFLSKGCEVDTKGDDGATPLEAAAGKGHFDIVKLLVEKGASINLQDKEGDCALGEAARGGHMDVVNYLLSKGADISLKNAEGQNPEEIARISGQSKVQALLRKKREG